MNTTKKGDKLEELIFEIFERQISEDRFFSKREFCKIYRKKGYYSKDREKNIVFDVSVEVTLPGQERYSVLFLIECKNYGHRVPVDDVEEFFAKIQQISGANAKGIVVATNSFQEGAFKFAKSKGIGLLRYYSKEQLDWVLTRSPSSTASSSIASSEWSNSYNALHDDKYRSKYFDFYGFITDTYTVSLNQFFSSLARTNADKDLLNALALIEQSPKDSCLCVPYLERSEVEGRATTVLSKVGYESGAVPLDSICAYLKEETALLVTESVNLPKGVLGQISFSPVVIYLDNGQASTNERIRFTLAHELGHFLLGHGNYMDRENCREEDIAIDHSHVINISDIYRMEWQANYFASCLLLPKKQFEQEFFMQAKIHKLFDRGYGLLYLDDQRCNIDTFYRVTAPLVKKFKVSRTVVKLRLIELGVLNEARQKPNKSFLTIRTLSRPLG